MARILVVDHDEGLQRLLETNLRHAGHDVVLASSGRDGLRSARERRPELVLLDLMLPDMPGNDLFRMLLQDETTREIPVMIVTARGDEMDRIVGFELGAADYVVKPFSVRELVLRVGAVLRRAARAREAPKRAIEFGCLRIDEEAHRVFVEGREIELTLLEYKLLVALYVNKSRVQTREALLDGVWGLDIGITSRTVDTHVKRLRDKLGPAGSYVETVRGIGYRFADTPDTRQRAANGE